MPWQIIVRGYEVKLQRQLSRKTRDKKYLKWVIVIPPAVIKKLGWKEGDILKEEIRKNKLILEFEGSK